MGAAGPPDAVRDVRLGAGDGRLPAEQPGGVVAVDGEPGVRHQLVRRQPRRHHGARAEDPAPALRLLPGPPDGCLLDHRHRPGPGPVAVHAAVGGAGHRRGLPGAVDQRLPGEPGAGRLPLRLRRGGARPSRG